MKTGLECLREELLKRGYNKAQAEAKVVEGVLQIIANDETGIYTRLDKAREEYEACIAKLEASTLELARVNADLDEAREHGVKLDWKRERLLAEERAELQARLDEANKLKNALEQRETPEARDALRQAEFFIVETKVETTANNTAFIQGLAMILAGTARQEAQGCQTTRE